MILSILWISYYCLHWKSVPPKTKDDEAKIVKGNNFHWCSRCGRYNLTHGTDDHITKVYIDMEVGGQGNVYQEHDDGDSNLTLGSTNRYINYTGYRIHFIGSRVNKTVNFDMFIKILLRNDSLVV